MLNHFSVSETKLWGVGGGGAGCKNVAFLDLLSCCPSCLAHLCQAGRLVLLGPQYCQESLARLGTPLGCLLQTCPASTLQSSFSFSLALGCSPGTSIMLHPYCVALNPTAFLVDRQLALTHSVPWALAA